LMEMLIDPILYQWVPAWVVEQYERANPFFKEVLIVLQREPVSTQRFFLKRLKREMVRRHHVHLKRKEDTKKRDEGLQSDSDLDADGQEIAEEADDEEDADELVRPLAVDGDDDPHAEKVEIDREARPQAGAHGSLTSGELSWETRTLEEQLSAAGAATQAPDRAATSDRGELNGGNQRDRAFGVVFNPKWSSETWLSETRNVNCRELSRIEQLRDAWYGKALVGDGADIVDRMDLDAWQKFAYDVVMDGRHSLSSPLRLFMLGSAGTGKSRTVRACVHGRRQRVRLSYEHELFRAGLAARQREESGASRTAARTDAEKEAANKFFEHAWCESARSGRICDGRRNGTFATRGRRHR
jgi:hypothetical protein